MKKSDKWTYIIGVAGVVLLIGMAFACPKIVFRIQDAYQKGRTWQGMGKNLDVEAMYSSYGSLKERLLALAERQSKNRDFYVTGTEHQRSAELLDMLDTIVSQEGYGMMEAYGIVPRLEEVKNRGYTIDEVKKYIIYNDIEEGESNAVVVSAWYIEFTTRQDITIKLLADTETYTLYYLQVNQENYFESKEDKVNWQVVYDAEYFLQEEWLDLWIDYYEADRKDIVVESEAQKSQSQTISMEMPYGDQTLQWHVEIQTDIKKKLPAVFSIGLKDIVDFIPELQRD